ncbi:MAG: hypothetical protein JJ971_09055 [Balneolaceae bacterium]|nr:hypothetical protein [Balneolaceae bacterium]MBO6546610.1 hypothetical protein [Balneolaceae bacterium]MBO6648968.1 hypothetical protein [Balneolaceae bacterium]
MPAVKTIHDVWEYLNSIPMFSKVGDKAGNFELKNITDFCDLIGNPQHTFKSIHVAGTNGKGTVCYLLEAVYKKAGFKTGMFTSPHLLKYNERFRVSGEEVADDLILEFFQMSSNALEKVSLTYFEISTAIAFWVFSKKKVDIAIIETGLGGRLDATNIITPELSIITSIGMDHEKILGNTLASIAKEKAGIIKSGKPIVIGDLPGEVVQVIESKALSKKANLSYTEDLLPSFNKGKIVFKKTGEEFRTQFIEPVNSWNVAICYVTVNELRNNFEVTETQFKEALESFPGVPARFEKLHPKKEWYFSGSHNEQAIDAMLVAVQKMEASKKILILSMMKDKAKPEILNKFRVFRSIYYYEQEGERAAKFSDIEPVLPIVRINENNYTTILKELNTELVICAGSFYFYPTIKRWLNKQSTKS